MSSKFISRSNGRSTVAASAYQSGQALYDRREGDMKSGYSKEEVAKVGILAPEGSPDWVKNREELWNRVEEFEDHLIHLKFNSAGKTGDAKLKTDAFREKRLGSAQLAQAMICALPRELTLEQNVELVEEFLNEVFVSKGFVADYAIHMAKGNPHVHYITPLRAIDGDGFAIKKETSYRRENESGMRNLYDRHAIKEYRKVWAEVTNRCLEKAGFSERIDPRSYKDQGIDLIPTRHRGYNVDKIERLGGKSRIVQENREIEFENVKRALENPSIILRKVAQARSVFTKTDVEREIFKLVGGDEKAFEALKLKVEGLPISTKLMSAVNQNKISSDEMLEELDTLASHYANQALEGVSSGDDEQIKPSSGRELGGLGDGASLDQLIVADSSKKDLRNSEAGSSKHFSIKPDLLKRIGSNVLDFVGFREERDQENIEKGIQERAVYLGITTRTGERLYTTPEVRDKETRIVGLIDQLSGKPFEGKPGFVEQLKKRFMGSGDADKGLHSIIESQEKAQGFTYSDQQRSVIETLIKPEQIQVLSGQAGTGKTAVLKGLSELYSKNGYKILGTAFQGKVAEALALETGQKAYTLDKLVRAWHKLEGLDGKLTPKLATRLNEFNLTSGHVVILDEGSMVSDTLWEKLLTKVQSSGAKLIVVQDQAQIKSLYGLDIPRYLEEKVGSVSLSEVRRQRIDWQREASALLNEHRVESALSLYDRNRRIIFAKELDQGYGANKGKGETLRAGQIEFDLKDRLVADFLDVYEKRDTNPYTAAVISALENRQVDDLNHRVLQKLMDRGDLNESFFVGETKVALGARIVFTQNDATERYVRSLSKDGEGLKRFITGKSLGSKTSHGVRNGTLGIIESFDEKRGEVHVSLKDGRRVGFNVREYDHIKLAYALTINKLQGSTYDRTFNLFHRSMDANKLLVQMTRHREDVRLYVQDDLDIHGMARSIGGGDRKDLIRDYSLTPDQHKLRDRVQAYRDISIKLGEAITLKRDIELNGTKVSLNNPLNQKIQSLLDERKGFALEILDSWKESKIYVTQENLRLETLEVHAGVRERSLSRFEVEAIDRVEDYFKASSDARSLWKELSKTHPGVLARKHESYKGYTLLREERNKLAHAIGKNPELHRRFLRMTTVQEGFGTIRGTIYPTRLGGMKSILAQGRQYEEALKKTYLREGLNEERKAFLEKVESFKESNRIVSQGYHQLKGQQSIQKGIEDGLVKGAIALKPEVEVSLKEIVSEHRLKRDIVALQVVRDLDQHVWASALLDHMGGDKTLHRQIIQRAYLGKLRESLDQYQSLQEKGSAQGLHTKDQRVNSESMESLTQSIGRMVYGSGSHALKKDRYAILKEYGLNPRDFRVDGMGQRSDHRKHAPANRDLGREERNAESDQGVQNQTQRNIQYKLDYREIRDHLSLDVEGYAHALLGKETTRSGKELLWNRKSSKISLNCLTGQWQDFKTGEKGDLITLTSYVKGGDKHEAYRHAAEYLGLTSNVGKISKKGSSFKDNKSLEERLNARRGEIDSKTKEQRIASMERVKELIDHSKSIEGTIAERYLREHRGIKDAELAEDLRFLPLNKDIKVYRPGLLSLARDSDGTVTACQVTYLDSKTSNKASGVKTPKMSYGTVSHSFVEVQSQGRESDTVYIAEGVETALSLKEAGIEGQIVAGLGLHNLGKAEHLLKSSGPSTQEESIGERKSQTLVIVADNDGFDASSTKQIQKIIGDYKEKGIKVQVVMPQGEEGRDFNDVLKEQGKDQVFREVQDQLGRQEVKEIDKPLSKGLEERRNEAHIISNTSREDESEKASNTLEGERSHEETRKDTKTIQEHTKSEPQEASGKHAVESNSGSRKEGELSSARPKLSEKELSETHIESFYKPFIIQEFIKKYGPSASKNHSTQSKKLLSDAVNTHRIRERCNISMNTTEARTKLLTKLTYEDHLIKTRQQEILSSDKDLRSEWVQIHRQIDRVSRVESMIFEHNNCRKSSNQMKTAKNIIENNDTLMAREIRDLIKGGMNEEHASLFVALKNDLSEQYGIRLSNSQLDDLNRVSKGGAKDFIERFQQKNVVLKESGQSEDKNLLKVARDSCYHYTFNESKFKFEELLKNGKLPSAQSIKEHMQEVGREYTGNKELFREHFQKQQQKEQAQQAAIQRNNQKDPGGFEM